MEAEAGDYCSSLMTAGLHLRATGGGAPRHPSSSGTSGAGDTAGANGANTATNNRDTGEGREPYQTGFECLI